ncbi:MAG: AAA family ATPase [Candidatus Paceibacterota bacterium]|jgi:hypothetical protein
MTQTEALNILKTGKNVFVTGPAGSGKTYVVNEYVNYLRKHDVPIGITASTGIAATHLGGMTVHSWSGMGIKNSLDEHELAELAERSSTAKRIREAQVLIIDEVSMLHHFRLDTLNSILKHIRKNSHPFGGMQIVLCGDFFQLPPVSRYGEPDTHFIYRSEAWREGGFAVCYLSENYRQTDDGILSVLNEIRSGEVSDEARETLKGRYRNILNADLALNDLPPTRLFTHNVDVDAVNDVELSKVDSPEFSYEMRSNGRKNIVEHLRKSCLAPEVLRLRKGARVMCVKNNFEQGYVNGTLGTVISCGPGVDPIIQTVPSVSNPNGRSITVESAVWQIEDNGRILAEIEQYPLRLAWAITVHKSQGMSLDAIEVDLSKAFEPGMGYVALSRVRTLRGLSLLGMNENAFRVHPEVLEYDVHLRDLSMKAERILQSTDERDVVGAHNEFLAKVAPLHTIDKTGRLVRGRKKEGEKSVKLSTYDKTALLVKAEKSLGEMAKERGVTTETIIAQIERLISGGKGVREPISMNEIMYLKKEMSSLHFSKIEKALEEVSVRNNSDELPLLSAIKTIVGPNVSWKEIRLARVILGYVKVGSMSVL